MNDVDNVTFSNCLRELIISLRMLGADSVLQASISSIAEGDYELALESLQCWNEGERDKIASTFIEFNLNQWHGYCSMPKLKKKILLRAADGFQP